MLQLSNETDERVAIHLNHALQEHVQLAFHLMRGTDRDFQCEIVENFQRDMPFIEVSQSGFARAIVNLLSNAFDAAAKKTEISVTLNLLFS